MNSFESELVREDMTQFPINNNGQLHLETSFSNSNPNQLSDLSFLEPNEEIKTDKARRVLGESGKAISSEQLESFIAQIEFLTSSWLDSYERQLFDGKTLREIT